MTKKIFPEDFIAAHSIMTREYMGYFQLNATEISSALKEYRVADTFCILAVTNIDLYLREESDFVYGLADMDICCGVFSFHRHSEIY